MRGLQLAAGKHTGAGEGGGMTSVDWFRNTDWDEEIESRFNEKLKRTRLKAQFLRIQASTLSKRHPEVSLKLLDPQL